MAAARVAATAVAREVADWATATVATARVAAASRSYTSQQPDRVWGGGDARCVEQQQTHRITPRLSYRIRCHVRGELRIDEAVHARHQLIRCGLLQSRLQGL